MSANLEPDLLAINNDSLLLQVWLPYLFGVALGKADVVAVLPTFTEYIAFSHSAYQFLMFSAIF